MEPNMRAIFEMGGGILNMINFLYGPHIHIWLQYVIYLPELWMILKKIELCKIYLIFFKIWKNTTYEIYFLK